MVAFGVNFVFFCIVKMFNNDGEASIYYVLRPVVNPLHMLALIILIRTL